MIKAVANLIIGIKVNLKLSLVFRYLHGSLMSLYFLYSKYLKMLVPQKTRYYFQSINNRLSLSSNLLQMIKKGKKNITLDPLKPMPSSGDASRTENENNINNHDAINFNGLETLEPFKASKLNRRKIFKQSDTRFLNDLKKLVKLRSNKYLQIIKNKKAQLTTKEYDELDFRARIHGKANTINENSKLDFKDINKIDRCNCGCKKGKGKMIPILADEQKLKALGPGILLQFLFTKATAVMLFCIIIIYCLFGLITNVIGSEADVTNTCSLELYCKFKQKMSDENKQSNSTFIQVQNWLGLFFCIFWILSTKVLKLFGQEKNRIIDQKLKTASDTTIKVENLPRERYQEKEVIAHFQELWRRKIKKEQQKEKELNSNYEKQVTTLEQSDRAKYDLKMKSIQIIYNMEFSRKINEEIFKLAEEVYALLASEDGNEENKNLVFEYEAYMKKKEKLLQTYELLKDLRKRFLNDPEFRKRLSTTCCIIEFENEKVRKSVLKYFGAQKMGILKQIQLRIKDCFTPNDQSVLFKKKVLRIERAPEPSDILWTNCEQPESLFRKLGIFSVSCFLMLISFAIVFGLEMLKIYIKRNPSLITVDIMTTVINYATSLALQIINSVFWQIMSALLEKEYNHTKTEKIISLMNRVMLLTSINVIVLPILSNWATFKLYGDNIVYGNEGLSGLCVDYHITSIIATIKKLFSLSAIVRTVVINWRWARHKMIWYYCKDPENINYSKGDPEVNKFYEGDEFDIAENYIFIISSILHAAFFCKLQPVILIIITANICLFFFVNKLKILRFCKIPDMTDYLVFDTSIWLLGLVPLYFGTGNIILSYLQQIQHPEYPFSLISSLASILCIIIGIFGISNPKGILNKMLMAIFNKCNCIDIADLMGEYEVDAIEVEDNSKDDSLSEISDEESKKKGLNNRIESYYTNSNSLSLLGLQKLLKGQDNKTSFKQLQLFCESFFHKNTISEEMGLLKKIATIHVQRKLGIDDIQIDNELELSEKQDGT